MRRSFVVLACALALLACVVASTGVSASAVSASEGGQALHPRHDVKHHSGSSASHKHTHHTSHTSRRSSSRKPNHKSSSSKGSSKSGSKSDSKKGSDDKRHSSNDHGKKSDDKKGSNNDDKLPHFTGCPMKQWWTAPDHMHSKDDKLRCRCAPITSASEKECVNPLEGVKFWNDEHAETESANDAAKWLKHGGNKPDGSPYPEPPTPQTWLPPLSFAAGQKNMAWLAKQPMTVRVGPFNRVEDGTPKRADFKTGVMKALNKYFADVDKLPNNGIPVIESYFLAVSKCGFAGTYTMTDKSVHKYTIDDYKTYIDGMVEAISRRKVIVLLEGDSGFGCPDENDRNQRRGLFHYAISRLMTLEGTAVYIDVGSQDGPVGMETMALRFLDYYGPYTNGMFVGSTHNQGSQVDLDWGWDILQYLEKTHKVDIRGLGIIVSSATNGLPVQYTCDGHAALCQPAHRAVGHVPTTDLSTLPEEMKNKNLQAAIWVGHVGGNTAYCFGPPRKVPGSKEPVGDPLPEKQELENDWKLLPPESGVTTPTYVPVYPTIPSPFKTGIFDPNIANSLVQNALDAGSWNNWITPVASQPKGCN